ncbi:hypothetical protein V5F44_18205 [Xanthobacter sp. V2C-8]|uniref:hypothetical protein n=1 Tax=Xanthobacter albus TaxID=3119929 RepID=UPI003729758B
MAKPWSHSPEIARAVAKLEYAISDVAIMAAIASRLVEHALTTSPEVRAELTGGRTNCYQISEKHVAQILHCVYRTEKMCEEVQEAYQRALGGEG